jgi:hypothetical protein
MKLWTWCLLRSASLTGPPLQNTGPKQNNEWDLSIIKDRQSCNSLLVHIFVHNHHVQGLSFLLVSSGTQHETPLDLDGSQLYDMIGAETFTP